MNKPAKVALALLAVAVIGGGVIVLTGRSADKQPQGSTSSQSGSNTSSNASSSDSEVAAVITYDGQNFNSSTDKIKAGQKVKVVNQSQNDLQFDSNPHPVHTDEPELNVGDIVGGGSKTFTITKKGTWGYHNHLNPNQLGQITVE